MPQSLQNINPSYYQNKYENSLIDLAEKENLRQRFMLGEKINTLKFIHSSLMHEKVCVKSCTMLDFIWGKIEDTLKEDCPNKTEGFFKVKKVYEEVHTKKEDCNIIEDCVPKIEW